MKIAPALLIFVALAIAPASSPPAVAQAAPSSAEVANASGPSGINAALLDGEFSLDSEPEIPARGRQKAFIDRVVGELKGNYGGTMVLEDPRLDWDVWRGWLLFENTGQTSGRYQEAGTIYNLDGAKE